MPQAFSMVSIGHLFIGLYFIIYGFWNVYHWAPVIKIMAERNIPHPYVILPIAILLQTVAGFFIISGIFVQCSALVLIPFTILYSLMIHPFWKYRGELTHNLQLNIFITNMTVILGALFLLAA